MKKIKYIACLLSLAVVSGCDSILDKGPLDSFTMITFGPVKEIYPDMQMHSTNNSQDMVTAMVTVISISRHYLTIKPE